MTFLHALLRRRTLIAFIVILALPVRLLAQAELSGELRDPAGAAVANVEITVTPAGAREPIQTTRTDAGGDFRFANLPVGTYDLRAAPDGFTPVVRRVTLNASQSARIALDVQLALAERVTVLGRAGENALPLDVPSETGSRLGLTARELPASLAVVPQVVMQARGQRTVQEAIESAAGVTVGDSPGNPANYSTRGFTANQVSVLQDGLRVGPPSMVSRPMDVWNLDRVEVLKGPASALFGEGAVGGAVNYVFRRPDRGPKRFDGLFSYGGFNTTRIGLGAGGPLGGSNLHYRVDYSRNDSDGFINRTPGTLQGLTSALLWSPSPTAELQLSFDVLDDDIKSYWGTPLVPARFASEPISGIVETAGGETVDARMKDVNYNVGDAVMASTTTWTRVKNIWRPATDISLRNEFYHLNADREWSNAETYAFNAETNLVDRDRFYVAHDQSIVGHRADLQVDRPIGQFANRFLAGVNVSALDFVRPSFFTVADSVDRFNPVPGVFGPIVSAVQMADINTAAFFVEDYFPVRSNMKLAGSVRIERLGLDRQLFNAAGVLNAGASFARVFWPVTWKAGAVYDVRPTTSLYGQIATAADPVSTDLFLVRADENFDLARGVQLEFGVKQALPRALGEWTAAVYRIERENILTQTSLTTAEPAGQQSSRGMEATLNLRPVPRWQLQANLALVDAQYDDFDIVAGGQVESRAGRTPANVPKVVFGVWQSYRFGQLRPLEIGASYRRVGARFSTIENTVTLLPYDLVDASATWTAGRYQVTVRGRNLFDKTYAAWADNFYPQQVLLGPPRSAEVSVGFKF